MFDLSTEKLRLPLIFRLYYFLKNNEEVVKEIVNGVYDYYYPQLLALEQTLLARL
jgi:hypothetical protein